MRYALTFSFRANPAWSEPREIFMRGKTLDRINRIYKITAMTLTGGT
jgi:hypothetical protein